MNTINNSWIGEFETPEPHSDSSPSNEEHWSTMYIGVINNGLDEPKQVTCEECLDIVKDDLSKPETVDDDSDYACACRNHVEQAKSLLVAHWGQLKDEAKINAHSYRRPPVKVDLALKGSDNPF